MERCGGSYWTGGSRSRCIDVVGVLRGVLAVLYGDSFQVELEPASLGSLNSTCRTLPESFPRASCKSPRRALQGMVNGNNSGNDPDPSIVIQFI